MGTFWIILAALTAWVVIGGIVGALIGRALKGRPDQWHNCDCLDCRIEANWTDNRKAIAEAIPPAYTEWIGRQLMDHLTLERAS